MFLLCILQQLQATVSGTSINATFINVNNATGVLMLEGLDSLEHYRTVLASVRYRNAGQLTPKFAFTGGVRTIVVQVRDGGVGGIAVANATVTCVEEQRIYVVGRDPAHPAPADCSGNGKLVIDPLTVRCRRVHVCALSALTIPCTQGRHVL